MSAWPGYAGGSTHCGEVAPGDAAPYAGKQALRMCSGSRGEAPGTHPAGMYRAPQTRSPPRLRVLAWWGCIEAFGPEGLACCSAEGASGLPARAGRPMTHQASRSVARTRPARSSSCRRVWIRQMAPLGSSRVCSTEVHQSQKDRHLGVSPSYLVHSSIKTRTGGPCVLTIHESFPIKGGTRSVTTTFTFTITLT